MCMSYMVVHMLLQIVGSWCYLEACLWQLTHVKQIALMRVIAHMLAYSHTCINMQ